MQSPYKRIIVYDLETGGTSDKFNSITEIAMVAIELETLSIIEEFSVLIKPRMDLTYLEEEAIRNAKMLYKNLATKDEDTGIKTLDYKGHKITLKNLDPLTEDIERFQDFLGAEYPDAILEYQDIVELEKGEWKEIVAVFFDNSYNPEALEITKIGRELFEGQGIEYAEAYRQVKAMIERHTVGNSKPIMAGHNIGSLPRRIVRGKEKKPDGFDNPFMEIFFKSNGDDFFYCINEKIIDTLKEARIKWYELPAFNLGSCANQVGLTLKEAHRALPDTLANAKLLIKMLQMLRGEGQQQSKYVRRKFNFNF